MEALIFPGGYQDEAGYEAVTWRVEGSRRHKLPGLEFFTTVRGTGLRGTDLDGLEPADPSAVTGELPLGQAGELTGCTLSGDLPCTVAVRGQRRPVTIAFSLGLRPGTAVLPGPAHTLTVSLVLDGVTCEAADDWFEDGVQRLERALPPGVQLMCCVTCLFSDYSPGGHGLTASAVTAGQGAVPGRAVQGRLLARSGHRGSPRDLPVRGIPAAHPWHRLPRLTQFAACPLSMITITQRKRS